MIIPDTHTLLLIFATIKLLLGFLLYLLNSRVPHIKGIKLWAYGSLITGLGFLIYLFSPYPVFATLSFAYSLLQNLCIMLGECLFFAGLQKFIGIPIKKSILLGFPLFVVVNNIVFSLIFHCGWIYLFINAFLLYILYSIAAVEFNKKQQKFVQLPSSWKFVFYSLASCALLNLIRAIFYVITKPINSFENNIIITVLILLTTICTALLTYDLILVVMSSLNDKLTEEIEFKNRLYAVIANDLRNPFETYENHVGVLKQSYNIWNSNQIKSWIYDIENVSLDSRFLVESLLSWCECQLKQNRISFYEQNIREVIDTAITHVQHLAVHKNIQILPPEHTEIKACFDTDTIRIVVENLYANIIQSTVSNGVVQTTIGCKNDKIGIIISNKDIGADAEELNKLFEIKKRDSPVGFNSNKVSGFGLLICKEFIELNGGEIMTKSTAEADNYFAFTLPLLSS